MITTDDELIIKWRKYFEDMLNCLEQELNINFNLENTDVQNCTEPTLLEVKSQLNYLENHKTPEEDEIQAEFLKKGGIEISL